MKLLCSILAVMILVLSCIPCADAEGFAMQCDHANAGSKTDGHHNPSPVQEHQDFCSPFCQCACCAVAYALPITSTPQVSFEIPAAEPLFASYLQQKPAGIVLPVWQPPRLV